MPATKSRASKERSQEYYKNIADAIEVIMKAENLSQSQLASALKFNQATLSKFLKDCTTSTLPFHVIVELCKKFELDFLKLVSNDFSYTTLAQRQAKSVDAQVCLLNAADLGPNFITDPKSEAFNGYLQEYYCYFLPTRSGEEELLLGKLRLSEGNGICRAEFNLYRNRADAEGGSVAKTYYGFAMISTRLHTMYVILYSSRIGELSVINFRYFNLNLQPLDCRLAEVLTNSAGANHVPTVHRMLLSREPIREEDLNSIKPHLRLNNDHITITEAEMDRIPCPHDKLIDHMKELLTPETYYTLSENYVRHTAAQVMDPEKVQQLICDFRSHSISANYNKVNSEADDNMHALLCEHNYYKIG